MPVKKSYRIGRSPTGLGLFAVTPIKKRQFIVQYSGRRITSAAADKLERYRRNKFLFEINKQWCVDGVSRRNIGRYVNHACRPNAEAVIRRPSQRIDYVAAAKSVLAGNPVDLRQGLHRDVYRERRLPLRELPQAPRPQAQAATRLG